MEIEYNRQVILGIGKLGSVFHGTFDGHKVAVKRVDLFRVIENEEKTLLKLDHPNVIKLFHSNSDCNFKYLALELCVASLDQLFLDLSDPRKYKGPPLPTHLTIYLQLASGLEYIHSKKFVHCNIKPESVLISVDSGEMVSVKWAGFGLSKSVNERGIYTTDNRIHGNRIWLAPELLRNIILHKAEKQIQGTVKSDIFSFALVLGCLSLDGQHLYGSDEFQICKNIIKQVPVNMKSFNPSHYARDLLLIMLENEPGKRIFSNEVVDKIKSIKFMLENKEKELLQLFQQRSLDLNKIKLCIQYGIDVNGKNNNGWNTLHQLCYIQSSEKLMDAIQLLIQLGVNVNGKDNYGLTALHLLCENNSSEKLIDAIKLLVQHGINVNSKDNIGRNALHCLCRNNCNKNLIGAIECLIQFGIDVNGKDNYGRNAFYFLCRFNSSEKLIEAIQLLIQKGINVKSSGIDSRSLLRENFQYAVNKKHIEEIIHFLEEAAISG